MMAAVLTGNAVMNQLLLIMPIREGYGRKSKK
jgi:hypothetical protein